jgi:hypothetical protein
MKNENKEITIDDTIDGIIGKGLAMFVLQMCSPEGIQTIEKYYGFKQEKEEFEKEFFYLLMFFFNIYL